MNILKNWIVDLTLTLLFIIMGILLLIPSISIKIVSIIVGILLITYYIFLVCPKYKTIKNNNNEIVIWIILESILIISLAVMAIITQNTSVNLFVATLKLNHIVGVTFIIEGIIGIVNITSIKENLNKQQLIKKYIYIIFIIIGTYIYLTININNLKIAYFISVLAFILGVIMLFFMFKNLPKKKNISLNKLN